jgi:hypothetical protein
MATAVTVLKFVSHGGAWYASNLLHFDSFNVFIPIVLLLLISAFKVHEHKSSQKVSF